MLSKANSDWSSIETLILYWLENSSSSAMAAVTGLENPPGDW